MQRSSTCTSGSGSISLAAEGGLAVEETLKLRLVLEKASTYRALRLLQLQGKATQQQQEQLLQLRGSIPLPQLVRSHAAARQDFLQEQEALAAAATAMNWSRWLPIWRGRTLKEQAAPDVNALGAAAAVPRGQATRPPLPPLSLQKLLDQQNRRQAGQQQPPPQHQEGGDLQEEEPFSDMGDFFDARSQVRLSAGASTLP